MSFVYIYRPYVAQMAARARESAFLLANSAQMVGGWQAFKGWLFSLQRACQTKGQGSHQAAAAVLQHGFQQQ